MDLFQKSSCTFSSLIISRILFPLSSSSYVYIKASQAAVVSTNLRFGDMFRACFTEAYFECEPCSKALEFLNVSFPLCTEFVRVLV
jgi:hypothetical protein